MELVGALTGAGVGLGLLLVAVGLWGPPDTDPVARRRVWRGASRRGLARVAAVVLAAAAAWVVTGWPVGAALAGLAAAVAPEAVGRARRETVEIERTEAVAAWTELLRDTISAAAGLHQAILATAEAAPEPIAAEVARLARRTGHGRLVDALAAFADEVANPAADLVVAALATVARREGGELAPVLSALARSTRAEADMHRRILVSRARSRTTARVITTIMAVFVGGLIVFSPDYLAPYDTLAGQLVLAVVGAIFAGGWWLLARMARLPIPDRVLTPTAETAGGR